MKRSRRMWRQLVVMGIATVVLAIFGARAVFAQDAAVPAVDELTSMKIGIDTSWVLLTGFLVFFGNHFIQFTKKLPLNPF